ncbi:hypothetical protein ACSBR2_035072 [Camellia fascicularis]
MFHLQNFGDTLRQSRRLGWVYIASKVKSGLKSWNVEVFGNVLNKLKAVEGELHSFDLLAEVRDLDGAEKVRRSEVRAEMWRTTRNEINSIIEEKVVFEDPSQVKSKVFELFKNQHSEHWPSKLGGHFPSVEGGHINPAVTFGLFLARKASLVRAILYIVAQCLGAICGCGLVKAFQKAYYVEYGGRANQLSSGYSIGTRLAAKIIGTFVLVYTVFSATDPKRNVRDSHVPVLAPLAIGFTVFMVHLATIPITVIGINPARNFGTTVIYGKQKAWDDEWIFWVGPFIGAAIAAFYHQYILRAAAIKALGSSRSNT